MTEICGNVHGYVSEYPNGEIKVKLEDIDNLEQKNKIWLSMNGYGSDLFETCLIVDAIRNVNKDVDISLHMEHVPYSRQDRVASPGDPFSLRAFAKVINSLNFSEVVCVEPHSSVCEELINNLRIRKMKDFFNKELIGNWFPDNPILVAPDKGAYERVKEIAEYLDLDFVSFHKVRNPHNGYIEEMTPLFEVDLSKSYLVVDDICDGGTTFIKAAQYLKGCKRLKLCVAHGFFGKGGKAIHELAKYYRAVYVLEGSPLHFVDALIGCEGESRR